MWRFGGFEVWRLRGLGGLGVEKLGSADIKRFGGWYD